MTSSALSVWIGILSGIICLICVGKNVHSARHGAGKLGWLAVAAGVVVAGLCFGWAAICAGVFG